MRTFSVCSRTIMQKLDTRIVGRQRFVESLWMSSSVHQDKLKRVELELEEEKSSVEMLTDRVSRSRDQIDQLRSELMQERSSKQDLELDKNAMERHVCPPALAVKSNTVH